MSEPKATAEEARARLLIYRELREGICACGAAKKPSQSFCRVHYFALPIGTRKALYDIETYVETYRRACGLLGLKEPAERASHTTILAPEPDTVAGAKGGLI